MTKLYRLRFNTPVGDWRPDPFPGSVRGCTCPKNQHAWPHGMDIAEDCKIHELMRMQ